MGAAWPFGTTDTHNSPTAPNLTTEITPPPPNLLQNSEGEAGVAWQGGRWQGGVGWTGKTRIRGAPTAKEEKKTPLCPTTTCACHHAHPPLCTGATRHGHAH